MPKAIFRRDFNYTSLKRGMGWGIKASKKPQEQDEEVIEAAVKAGAAERVLPEKAKKVENDQETGTT